MSAIRWVVVGQCVSCSPINRMNRANVRTCICNIYIKKVSYFILKGGYVKEQVGVGDRAGGGR